ncbi:hypothetical protein SETIT_2G085400v2 [Setaria italica]|uniref:Uncharacterized protein n=1 Tax=Setaria italica TaxID=4555 RepID=A0A368PWE9_SETIT|nr:hypothetical protein SETIT_2G085400v2 [Setaria italica]
MTAGGVHGRAHGTGGLGGVGGGSGRRTGGWSGDWPSCGRACSSAPSTDTRTSWRAGRGDVGRDAVGHGQESELQAVRGVRRGVEHGDCEAPRVERVGELQHRVDVALERQREHQDAAPSHHQVEQHHPADVQKLMSETRTPRPYPLLAADSQ